MSAHCALSLFAFIVRYGRRAQHCVHNAGPAFSAQLSLHNAKPLCALRGTIAERTPAEQSLHGTICLSSFFFSIASVQPQTGSSINTGWAEPVGAGPADTGWPETVASELVDTGCPETIVSELVDTGYAKTVASEPVATAWSETVA